MKEDEQVEHVRLEYEDNVAHNRRLHAEADTRFAEIYENKILMLNY